MIPDKKLMYKPFLDFVLTLSSSTVKLQVIKCRSVPWPVLLHNTFTQWIEPFPSFVPSSDCSKSISRSESHSVICKMIKRKKEAYLCLWFENFSFYSILYWQVTVFLSLVFFLKMNHSKRKFYMKYSSEKDKRRNQKWKPGVHLYSKYLRVDRKSTHLLRA